MQKQTIALAAGALLFLSAGAMLVPQWLADDEVPLVRWDAKDEVEVAATEGDTETEGSLAVSGGIERIAAEGDGSGALPDEARVALILRGRIVNKFQGPVEAATVWLDFGRGGPRGGGPGGRQRRVPDPVQSDREGRFAFQGQTFRNLRVSLQVGHANYSPGLFDKDLGEVTTEVDLGDLVLTNGGEVIGRVTDLEGNGIAGADIDLGPDGGNNRMRMVRNRENLMPKIVTDNNGFYRQAHVMAGEWTAGATAKRHTQGRSPTFVVEEDQVVEVEDIRLGPGFEVTGYVRTAQGQPIAKADVTLRSINRGGRGRGPGSGPGGNGGPGNNVPEDWRAMFGRDHSTETDEQGRFFLEHLPSVPMHIEARADGYLDYDQEPVDPTLGQPVHVVMQDGLRIAGTVVDGVDSQVVSLFAVRATRVRGLPVAGQAQLEANIQDLMTRLRDRNLDEATRQQLGVQVESLRATANVEFGRGGRGDRGGNGGPGGRGNGNTDNGQGGGRGPARDLGKPEKHPGGTFVITGLQEGVYEVSVQSPEHARFRSQEVEVRLGLAAPTVAASLDRGLFVAGVVLSEKGAPVKGATVELRAASNFDPASVRRRGERGGRGGNNGEAPTPAAPPTSTAPGNGYEQAFRDFQRMAAGTLVTIEATTDAEGVFVIKHAARGSYRLQAQARGFADANSDNFDLQADRSGVELKLGLLGSVAGTVRGLRSKEITDAHVAAMQVGGNGGIGMFRGRGGNGGPGGGGPFNSVTVKADGTYRIDDLLPGDYIVRSWVGSAQDMMREMAPQFFSNTPITPDVKVKGGEVSNLDLTVVRPQIGEVAGTVMHNGNAAAGFRVELTLVDENGAASQQGRGGRGQGGPGGRQGGPGLFGGGRSFQATVASSGNFSIKDVPAGSYRLRVQPARRGGTLLEELVQVVADATTERNLQVSTASVRGTVTRDDGGNAAELNGSVMLLAGLTAMPENLQQWRRDQGNSTVDARVQNGAFKFETLKPDNYLLVLTIRGRERTSLPVVVTAGSEQSVVVAAGKVAAPAGNSNGGNGTPQPGQPARPNGNTGR